MSSPPDPSIPDNSDKCLRCGKPLTKHTYKEQVECSKKNNSDMIENEESDNDIKNELDESDNEMVDDDEITGPTDNGRVGDSR